MVSSRRTLDRLLRRNQADERPGDIPGDAPTHSVADLYASHSEKITALIYTHFGNGPPDPEDITQAAFHKLMERSDLSDIRDLGAFLWMIARNLVLKEKRSMGVRSRYDYEVEALYFAQRGDVLSPERVLSANEQLKIINQALREMPERRRRAFVLNRIEGLNVSAVARRLKLSRTAANKHIVRAVEDIDRYLDSARDER
ncbi:MAG: sigma-70 family RNA polymerase sigma factor [Pseudomonadota bacterium]